MKLYSRILTGYFKEKPVSLNYTTRHVQPTMNQPILGTINEGEGVESWIWGVTWIGSSAAIAPSSQLYVTAFQPPSFALLSFPSRRRCTPVLCSPVFHLSPKKKKTSHGSPIQDLNVQALHSRAVGASTLLLHSLVDGRASPSSSNLVLTRQVIPLSASAYSAATLP